MNLMLPNYTRWLFKRLISLGSLIILLIPTAAKAGDGTDCEPGVLVKCKPEDGTNFLVYVAAILRDNTILIITIASLLIVFSGVQYMLAMGNSSEQAKAKQRIIGIVGGIIFFTLVQFTLTLLANDLNVQDRAATPSPTLSPTPSP